MVLQTYARHDVVQRLEVSAISLLEVLLRRQVGHERLVFLEKPFDLKSALLLGTSAVGA